MLYIAHILTIMIQVNLDMNENLLRAFSVDEVRVAVFGMSLTKAPGYDGMPKVEFGTS